MSLTLQTSCAKQRLTSPSHFCCLAVSFKNGSRPKITHQWAGTTLNHHQPPGISGIAPMYVTTGTPLAIVISKDLWWFFPLPQIFQSSEAQRHQVNSPWHPKMKWKKTTAFPVISSWFQQPGTACVTGYPSHEPSFVAEKIPSPVPICEQMVPVFVYLQICDMLTNLRVDVGNVFQHHGASVPSI